MEIKIIRLDGEWINNNKKLSLIPCHRRHFFFSHKNSLKTENGSIIIWVVRPRSVCCVSFMKCHCDWYLTTPPLPHPLYNKHLVEECLTFMNAPTIFAITDYHWQHKLLVTLPKKMTWNLFKMKRNQRIWNTEWYWRKRKKQKKKEMWRFASEYMHATINGY